MQLLQGLVANSTINNGPKHPWKSQNDPPNAFDALRRPEIYPIGNIRRSVQPAG